MKNLIKLICIVVLTLSLNGCATFKITTAGHETVEEISTLNQLRWKMQRDWRFQQDYVNFVTNQPYSWYSDYYSNNFMWRYGYTSQWSFYINRFDMWSNWSMNSSNWWGQHWYSPWHSNVYGNWNMYGWNSWYQTPHYMYNRRGSRQRMYSGVYSFNNRTNRSRLLIDSKVSTSDSRTLLPNTASPIQNSIIRNNSKPRVLPNTKPTVITRPPVIINKPIWNNSKPVIRNTNKPRINNSSSRPNLNSRPSRSSVPKTTTKSSRKPKGN
jgi:hypothetical protein